MLRSHKTAVATLALFASSTAATAQTPTMRGEQCIPAVANLGSYHNCHLRIVAGSELCRCRVLSRTSRSMVPQESATLVSSDFTALGTPSRPDRPGPAPHILRPVTSIPGTPSRPGPAPTNHYRV